jgi:hypothetical protein
LSTSTLGSTSTLVTQKYVDTYCICLSNYITPNKNYYETGINLCRICFNVLDTHIANTHKMAPASAPSTISWNSSMMPNKIFEQFMSTYSKPTSNAMHQNNLMFISTYSKGTTQAPLQVLRRLLRGCHRHESP